MTEITVKPDELEVYREVGRCETVEELKACIEKHFPHFIQGRTKEWPTSQMMHLIDGFVSHYKMDMYPAYRPTREFGIRQQLLYILFCEKHKA